MAVCGRFSAGMESGRLDMRRVIPVLGVAFWISSAVVGSSALAREGLSAAELGLAAAFEGLEPVSEGVRFEPAADPSVPDEGEPNQITRVNVVALDLGRSIAAGDVAVTDRPGIEELNAGSAAFGVNQTTLTVVMVEVDRAPVGEGNLTENLSLAFSYSGEEALAASPFANDPLIGFEVPPVSRMG
jgi:hypothetical protein